MSAIYLISGIPGAGKSTVCDALCERFPRAMHVDVDELRHFVKAGYASPTESWSDETTLQFSLAHRSACDIARRYRERGFVVTIDDVVDEPMFADYAPLAPLGLRKVFLAPSLEVALARNGTRADKGFHPSALVDSIRRLHPRFARENTAERGWLVIDSSALRVDETVDAIMARWGS